jgi:catechol 2,3-dioxygenase-like lactoylglutathione lyase family enzyme
VTIDLGLTHIALPVSDIDCSIEFYATYARMQTIHRRIDPATGVAVVWLSDLTRPFENGMLYERFPDGSSKVVKTISQRLGFANEPPTTVKIGARRKLL